MVCSVEDLKFLWIGRCCCIWCKSKQCLEKWESSWWCLAAVSSQRSSAPFQSLCVSWPAKCSFDLQWQRGVSQCGGPWEWCGLSGVFPVLGQLWEALGQPLSHCRRRCLGRAVSGLQLIQERNWNKQKRHCLSGNWWHWEVMHTKYVSPSSVSSLHLTSQIKYPGF